MDQGRVSKSRVRIAAGSLLILGCLVWAVYFSFAVPLEHLSSAYAKITVWAGVIVGSILLFLGLLVLAENVDMRKMFLGFIFFLVWSLGLPLIPVPEGYGEGVLGIYFLLLIAALWLYSKFMGSKKKAHQR